jgi:hypothetical protein
MCNHLSQCAAGTALLNRRYLSNGVSCYKLCERLRGSSVLGVLLTLFSRDNNVRTIQRNIQRNIQLTGDFVTLMCLSYYEALSTTHVFVCNGRPCASRYSSCTCVLPMSNRCAICSRITSKKAPVILHDNLQHESDNP